MITVDDNDDDDEVIWCIVQTSQEARESVLAAMFQHDIPPPFVDKKGLTHTQSHTHNKLKYAFLDHVPSCKQSLASCMCS